LAKKRCWLVWTMATASVSSLLLLCSTGSKQRALTQGDGWWRLPVERCHWEEGADGVDCPQRLSATNFGWNSELGRFSLEV
jgi:hypothetical protein